MRVREFLSDVRGSFKRPTRKDLATTILPMVICLVLVVAISALMAYVIQDPDEFAEEFAAKYDKYVYLGIFLITLFSSFTIFLPAPGTFVVIALVSTLDLNIGWAAIVGATGGTLGEISAYWLGYSGRGVIDTEHSERYQSAEKWMKSYGAWTIVLFAFVPFLLFDLAGIAAGALKYPVKKFLFFCWVGRFPRALLEYSLGAGMLDWTLDHLPWKT